MFWAAFVFIIVNSTAGATVTTSPMFGNTDRQLYSLDFDGIDDYVEIADNDVLDLNLDDFTVEAWVFPRCEISDLLHSFIRKMDMNRNGYAIVVDDLDLHLSSSFRKYGSFNEASVYINIPIEYSQWYHVSSVLDRDVGHKLYINGILVADTLDTKLLDIDINNPFPLLFGIHPGQGEMYADGQMHEVKIWNRASTETEVQNSFSDVIPYVTEKGRNKVLHGTLTAAGAGSVNDPLERYDIIVVIG